MTRTIASVQEMNRLLETQKQQLQLTLTQTLLAVTPDDCRRMPLALSNTDSSPEKNVALLLEDMEDVTLKLYENDRHEILNETDKDVVYEDILNWLTQYIETEDEA